MSHESLALEAKLHRTVVTPVERGIGNISFDNIEKLANALNIPMYQLSVPA
ncbi:MAG: XRE family transcriptional regulator [Dechloromonas sp.]|nr:MAG: XRE family transcriptional regulator [Dechloromonas sp.]